MNRIHNSSGLPIDKRIGMAPLVERPTQKQNNTSQAGMPAFKEIFRQEIFARESLCFSAHALGRLASRNIQLTSETINKLAEAVDRAATKGAQDALLLIPGSFREEDIALIVSVANRTVITAVNGENMCENVFTNIDSAIIINGKEENPQVAM